MATGFVGLLRARYEVRLLVGTLVARLPNATGPLVILLFIRAAGGSYSLAGALSATYGLATAVRQPLLGRLVDLHGAAAAVAGCAGACGPRTAAADRVRGGPGGVGSAVLRGPVAGDPAGGGLE